MGPRQRQGRSRSKTHALPIILLSFLGFLLIAGVAFGIGMVGNVNRCPICPPTPTPPRIW